MRKKDIQLMMTHKSIYYNANNLFYDSSFSFYLGNNCE